MKTRPAYAIASVDNALRLATILQLEGALSVSEGADRLGVARSTAHRLISMLCYRDFAVQSDDRTYRAGPVLAGARTSSRTSARLRSVALPHMTSLMGATHETANLTVLSGPLVRFLACIESRNALRVGTREGMAFPAHKTSTGLAMLAALSTDDVGSWHARATENSVDDDLPTLSTLRQQLTVVRNRGFAINNERTERGIVAIGIVVPDSDGGLAGISLSMPSVRFSRDLIPALVRELSRARSRIARDLNYRSKNVAGGETNQPAGSPPGEGG